MYRTPDVPKCVHRWHRGPLDAGPVLECLNCPEMDLMANPDTKMTQEHYRTFTQYRIDRIKRFWEEEDRGGYDRTLRDHKDDMERVKTYEETLKRMWF